MNNDPLAYLGAGGQFPPASRYHNIEIVQLVAADGRTIAHLRRRFVPPLENFATVQEHRVVEGERLDHLAARYLGDPEQFWKICDANNAFIPSELTDTPGRTLRITLPEGFSAPPPTHA
jgi:hypothetical protein